MKIISGLVFMVAIALIIAVISGCQPRTAPPAPVAAPVTRNEQESAAKTGWEAKWEKTLQMARREGKLVVYASSVAPALKEAVPMFRQKYGIEMDVITGRGSELRNRLIQEQTNRIYVTDIMISGMNTVLGSVKPEGAAQPVEPLLILPEVLDEKAYFRGKFPWGDKDKLVVNIFYYPSSMININTSLVKPGEITSYLDLLDPKWTNKVLINDPTVTGSGFNGFASLLYNKIVDESFFRKLVSQQDQMTRDQRLQADWLARGKYPVTLWAVPEQLHTFEEAGSPISSLLVKEGTYLSVDGGGVVYVKNAPHPNASAVFMNWVLSKEGHQFMADGMQQQGSRDDIPTNKIQKERVREKGKEYFVGANNIEDWILTEQDRYLELAKQLFRPLTQR